MTTPAAAVPAAQDTPKAAADTTKTSAPDPKMVPDPKGADPKAAAEGTKDPAPKADEAQGKAGEPKGAEGAKPEAPGSKDGKTSPDVKPEEYTLAAPDGSPLTQEAVSAIETFAKEQKLTKAQAEAFLAREGTAVTASLEAQKAQVAAKVTAWQEEAKSKHGEKLAEMSEHSKRALEAFGSKEFIKVLEDTGMGNYPPFLEAWAAVGRAMGDDRILTPPAQPAGKRKEDHEVFYGEGVNAE